MKHTLMDAANPLGVKMGLLWAVAYFIIATLWLRGIEGHLPYTAALSGLVFAAAISTARIAYAAGFKVGSISDKSNQRH